MAKRQSGGTSSVITVKNLSSGPRDYPLNNGSSIYLPPRSKGITWPEIPAGQISKALLVAEKKGAIELIGKNEPETSVEVPKEASE